MKSNNESALDLSNRNTDLEKEIRDLIVSNTPEVFCFRNVDSVMDLAKKVQHQGSYLLLADKQTKGRGQHGRQWTSPEGALLACICFLLNTDRLQTLPGLSLVMALQVRNLLEEYEIKSKVKWPNDILIEISKRKICGILLESATCGQSQTYLRIGIGLNLLGHPEYATSVYSEIKNIIPRQILIAKIYNKISAAAELFLSEGFSAFTDEWNENDLYKDQEITFQSADNQYRGSYAGVDENANLLLISNQTLLRFSSGHILVPGLARNFS